MGRPRKFDAEHVDEALLGVFWSSGYAGASIEELSAATGLLRGSLYAAYGDKEGMFRAAARRYAADLAAALTTDKTGLDAAQHVLDTVVRLTVGDPQRRGCVILNAIPESHAFSAQLREELQGALRPMQALLRHRLREAQAEAGTDLDLEPLTAMLFAASVAIRVLGRAGQDHKVLAGVAEGAIEAARRRFAEGLETPNTGVTDQMHVDERERNRRRALVRAHYAAENEHDLGAIMNTFSADAVMLYNRQPFSSDEAIRGAHSYLGMTAASGALSDLRAHIDEEHFTDEEVVVEGRLTGRHSREFLGFQPTGREVELPFVAFYRFDADDKLTSERVVMNLGPLSG